MYSLVLFSLLVTLAQIHSAPVDSSILVDQRDSKQLLTLAEFSKKVGNVIGEELQKVVEGAWTVPPPPTPAPTPAPTQAPEPVTEEQTIIVYITEPPQREDIQTAAPVLVVQEVAQPAPVVQQPEPAPFPTATSAPEIAEVTETELVEEVSTVDEDEEETEAAERATNEPEIEVTAAAATAAPVAITAANREETEDAPTQAGGVDEGSTLYDVSTLPPPFVGNVRDTTEDDESDDRFNVFPTAQQSVVESAQAAQQQQQSTAVPAAGTQESSTASGGGGSVDEDDDDNDEDDDYELSEDYENRRAKAKKVVKKIF